jgi:hypothetical protein
LSEENNREGVKVRSQGPDLLFSVNPSITQEDILASIPPKEVLDRLMSRYFGSMDMAPGLSIQTGLAGKLLTMYISDHTCPDIPEKGLNAFPASCWLKLNMLTV